jgi:hypothetical protein
MEDITGYAVLEEAPDTCSGVITVHSPLPDNHPVYRKIGLLVAKWAYFEHLLDVLYWEVSRLPPSEGIFETGMIVQYQKKKEALLDAVKQRVIDTSIKQRLEALLTDAEKQSAERNRAVHDAWYEREPDKALHQYKGAAPAKLKHLPDASVLGLQPIDEMDLDQTIAMINRHVEKLLAIRGEILRGFLTKPR